MPEPTRRAFLATGSMAGFGLLGFPLGSPLGGRPPRLVAGGVDFINIETTFDLTGMDPTNAAKYGSGFPRLSRLEVSMGSLPKKTPRGVSWGEDLA